MSAKCQGESRFLVEINECFYSILLCQWDQLFIIEGIGQLKYQFCFQSVYSYVNPFPHARIKIKMEGVPIRWKNCVKCFAKSKVKHLLLWWFISWTVAQHDPELSPQCLTKPVTHITFQNLISHHRGYFVFSSSTSLILGLCGCVNMCVWCLRIDRHPIHGVFQSSVL